MESFSCFFSNLVLFLGLILPHILGVFRQTMAADVLPQDFDASDVTWAHAVNSRELLERELAGSVDFLEADVSLGHVLGNEYSPAIPVMAHPPNTTSDISLDTWLDIVIARRTGKGLKLDFKSIEVVESSLLILQRHAAKLNFSLWLNADVLPGPINSSTTPVQFEYFLSLCHQYFPTATLSVGWTTYWFSTFPPDSWHYEWKHVRRMADVIRCSSFESRDGTFTFPLRGVFASRSIRELQWLLGAVPGSSLTIWSAKFDPLELEDLLKIRRSFPKSKVYYDIPEPLNGKFKNTKNNVVIPPTVSNLKDTSWMTITRGKGDSCSSYTYISNNTVVFGKSLNTAVLMKNVFSVDINHRLQVRGKVRFFNIDEQYENPQKNQELVIVLADVSSFAKNESSNSEERLDLTASDTDVVWNAVNISRLHTFQHKLTDVETACRMFSLDTTRDHSFQAWTVPCDVLQDGSTFDETVKNGHREVPFNKRLVLPEGPFMFGLMSSGEGNVVIYDLEIIGTKDEMAPSLSAAAKMWTSAIALSLVTIILLL